MPNQAVSALETLGTAPARNDSFPVVDASAGTTKRVTYANLTHDVYNVNSYGTVQLALDAVESAGGSALIYFPPGVYDPGEGWTLDSADDVIILGAGHATIIRDTASMTGTGGLYITNSSRITLRSLRFENSNGPAFYIDADAAAAADVTVDDVHVVTTGNEHGGIVTILGAGTYNRVTIRNSTFRQTGEATSAKGIIVGSGGQDSSDLLIESVLIDGYWRGFDTNHAGSWVRSQVTDCKFMNATNLGARFYHFGSWQIDNCLFSGNDAGALLDNDGNNYRSVLSNCRFIDNVTLGAFCEEWNSVSVTGCVFESNGTGTAGVGLWLASSRNVSIAGSVFNKNNGPGLLVDDNATFSGDQTYSITNTGAIADVTMSGCTFMLNETNGIEIKGSRSTMVLSGCQVMRNGQAAAGSAATSGYTGLLVADDTGGSNPYNIRAVCCTFGNGEAYVGSTAGKQQYGIRNEDNTGNITAVGCGFYEVETPIDWRYGTKMVVACDMHNGNSLQLDTGSTATMAHNLMNGGTLDGSAWDGRHNT